MNQTNSIIIDGNLVKDGVFSEPKQGFKVCRLTVAVNRWYKNENGEAVDKVSYFDVETYANSAEFCSKYAKKGLPVRVVGRLQQDRWTTKEGKMDSKVYVVAEHVELLKKPFAETEKKREEGIPAGDAKAGEGELVMQEAQEAQEEAVAVF
ncbi:MAG: single-stranded DNA-binding protein [Treponema sp.]|nr:single-stranded DNA-binding protein [Treponema sp.]